MSEAPAAWQDVATRLRPFIARRVSPAEIDDVMQDVFVRMQRGLPALRDEERFTSWLFQIARSSVAEHMRTRARHPIAEASASEQAAANPTQGDEDDRDAARALAGCVSMFVAQLATPYREAVTLVELEGLTMREAAEMVGISVSGMKSRVQRGRAQLRQLFDQCCEIAIDARGKPTDFTPRGHPACKPCT
ncbi:MAG: sigma-70 family RNA polymerase sigma factor [Kofleriaceae bacterium]